MGWRAVGRFWICAILSEGGLPAYRMAFGSFLTDLFTWRRGGNDLDFAQDASSFGQSV